MLTPMSVGLLYGHSPKMERKIVSKDQINFNIAVVVDRRLAVGLEVEGVDHVDIGQIRRRRLVGKVDRV